ncbi:hypothetical protein EJB05_48413, partial [Eragrostis curvula]
MKKVESRGGIALAAVVATLLLLPPPHGAVVLAAAAATVQENNCTRSCGNISIPYPFGVEPGCYHASGFNLTCDHSYRPPKLFLGDGTVEVLEISAPSSTVSINSSFVKFTDNHDGRTANGTWGGGLPKGGPFFLSADLANSVAVVGCEVQVDLRGGDNNDLLASCFAMCPAAGPPYQGVAPPNVSVPTALAVLPIAGIAAAAPAVIKAILMSSMDAKVKKMKEKFFRQNHGLLLQQLVSQKADIGERMIITLSELEKATNNFDRARVVGGGGHGVVFKGILHLHVVAIKKSKIVVQREIDEFINEVVVLSQVNHRNVVKLLGCCLEAEVPLLVYEFVSNGTLYHHLHVERPISLPWDDRVRIAMEIARALSYLHSAASMPIFHRDIKSSNILLDETLTTKVSDFGASRYIPIDKTGITTAVQGTIGYLDPMYYYTGRLTDKSDVFSFGVLVIELLTRKKPFVYLSNDGDGLVSHFVSLLGEGKLIDIIDPQVIEEEEGQVLQEVGELAAMCTKLNGEDRPTMREVEMELENLLVKKKQVSCDTTTRYENENVAYKPIERVTKESSRQYTMEEEILLSASYPR